MVVGVVVVRVIEVFKVFFPNISSPTVSKKLQGSGAIHFHQISSKSDTTAVNNPPLLIKFLLRRPYKVL